ncbi:receptor-type tyrosine-protein phosphatase alpha-like isoform X1 [Huso huso]|uniref:protein-tyrosine-phosphatase n=1 Tax=Huso huso TaxID=61971 RepID=A0ABR1A5K0_HUSHU
MATVWIIVILLKCILIVMVMTHIDKTQTEFCTPSELLNIRTNNTTQKVKNGTVFKVTCKQGFMKIKKVVCKTNNKGKVKWNTRSPCIGIPKVTLSWMESSSESISLVWNHTEISHPELFLNMTMACQLNSSFGGDCDQRKNASVSHNGKTNCTSLQPFSRYALVFTVNAYKSKSQLFTKKVALPEQTFYVNTTPTVPDKPEIKSLPDTSAGRIQWKPLSECNGRILYYELNYTGKRDYNETFQEASSLILNSSETSCTLPGLKSGTNYSLEIRGYTEAGAGHASRSEFETKITEPVLPDLAGLTVFNISSGTACVSMTPVSDINGPISCYQLIMQDLGATLTSNRSVSDVCQDSELPALNRTEAGAVLYITAEIQAANLTERSEFTVGDGEEHGPYFNAPLRPGKNYSVILRVVSRWKQDSKFSCSEYNPFYVPSDEEDISDKATTHLAAITVCLLFIVICFVLLAVLLKHYYSRRQPIKDLKKHDNMERISLPQIKHPDPPVCHSETEVSVEQLLEYVVCMKKLGWSCEDREEDEPAGLRKEYLSLPKQFPYACSAAKQPSNKEKNRYCNAIPYDASRVLLKCFNEDPDSDYINASFINGYEKTNCYIATQGPLPSTVTDFWRMVWENNSFVIVMLTSLVEKTKLVSFWQKKCEQYWPEDCQTYGDVFVSLQAEERSTEITTRTFDLRKVSGSQHRTVKQFHYSAWPDHGTPRKPLSLLCLIRQANSWLSAGPMIVHCSAGIGRTGAFIAIDQLLHAAEAVGRVDVFQCIYNMRKQRKNMVQTEEQYLFVYDVLLDVLLEALLCDVTEVPAQQVHRRIRELQVVNPRTRITGYQKELQALNKLSEVFRVRPHKEALKPTNHSKNRDPYILPADHFRPALMSLTNDDGSPGYINAVFADGFTKKDSFIITQFPLKDTVTDFWALVYDYNCTSLIMMNRHEDLDETFPLFWPRLGDCTHGPFCISISSEEQKAGFTSRTLMLSNTKQRMHHARHIKMLQLDDWPVTDPLPMSRDTVIHMLRDTEDWQRRNNGGATLVMCQDGASRSGLFCAASQIREQIRMEGKVDVLQAVKTLRSSRPELIRDMEQYTFCYQIAVRCVDCPRLTGA